MWATAVVPLGSAGPVAMASIARPGRGLCFACECAQGPRWPWGPQSHRASRDARSWEGAPGLVARGPRAACGGAPRHRGRRTFIASVLRDGRVSPRGRRARLLRATMISKHMRRPRLQCEMQPPCLSRGGNHGSAPPPPTSRVPLPPHLGARGSAFSISGRAGGVSRAMEPVCQIVFRQSFPRWETHTRPVILGMDTSVAFCGAMTHALPRARCAQLRHTQSLGARARINPGARCSPLTTRAATPTDIYVHLCDHQPGTTRHQNTVRQKGVGPSPRDQVGCVRRGYSALGGHQAPGAAAGSCEAGGRDRGRAVRRVSRSTPRKGARGAGLYIMCNGGVLREQRGCSRGPPLLSCSGGVLRRHTERHIDRKRPHVRAS